ncbi:MAG: class I SAM-dependent methyltransferase, partial [Deltaproteobacteria bacterium]|nr:class I SAM-dependent methyltransferase [Deltaproteobacteria bacterium]
MLVERRGEYALFLCASCGLVFSDPMRGAGPVCYRKAEADVDYWTRGPGLGWHHRQFLERVPACGGRLLDVGCGTGEFMASARDAGYDVWGIDFVAEKIEAARRRRGLVNAFVMTASELASSLPGKRFDVATCFEVIEHLEDPAGFIAQIKTLLNPGGYLAISVPNRVRTFAVFEKRENDGPPHHLTRWDLRSIAGFLERNGFMVVDSAIKRPDLGGWIMARTGSAFASRLFSPV